MELWRNAVTAEADEGKSTADVATRLIGEFEGVQKAVKELQASFAKVSLSLCHVLQLHLYFRWVYLQHVGKSWP